jgi:hypothetical protein
MNLILQTNPLCCLPGQNRRIIISSQCRNDTFFQAISYCVLRFLFGLHPEIIPMPHWESSVLPFQTFIFYLNAIDRRFIHFLVDQGDTDHTHQWNCCGRLQRQTYDRISPNSGNNFDFSVIIFNWFNSIVLSIACTSLRFEKRTAIWPLHQIHLT